MLRGVAIYAFETSSGQGGLRTFGAPLGIGFEA
jgi:hypothetical protein